MPGTQAAGFISEVPLGNTFAPKITLRISGKAVPSYFKAVSPGISKVFGYKMAAGRFFDSQDTPDSQIELVVNQTFARFYSPDSHDPNAIVGRKLFSSSRSGKSSESVIVIGVLRDERQQEVQDPAQPEVNLCLPQIRPGSMSYYSTEGISMDLALRTSRPTVQIIPELREILDHASPELRNADITTMNQIVADSYGSQRLAAHLLEIFGG